jgi:hypothetical protein
LQKKYFRVVLYYSFFFFNTLQIYIKKKKKSIKSLIIFLFEINKIKMVKKSISIRFILTLSKLYAFILLLIGVCLSIHFNDSSLFTFSASLSSTAFAIKQVVDARKPKVKEEE